MDTPASNQPPPKKWKRDPEKNKVNQKLYRRRLMSTVDGMEQVRAQNRRRYFERIDRLKANGEYEAFKAKKSKEGMKRYHALPKDKRDEIRRKNRILNRQWMQRMREEGTYDAYKERLNRRRRELVQQKKQAMGAEAYNALQQRRYQRRVEGQLRQRWDWMNRQLERPFPLEWLPLDWDNVKPIEDDPVQTVRAQALEQMDQLL